MEGRGKLVDLCLEAATRSPESVRSWRKQRRTLERLPVHLAESLLQQLLVKNFFSPPLLELFQFTVEELNLNGEIGVNAEWMAYIGGFRYLRVLKAEDSKFLTDSAIWHLSGMEWIEELQINRCAKITSQGLEHVVTLSKLKRLGLSETGIGEQVIGKLAVLTNLIQLDLGNLPVTDSHVSSLLALQQLVELQLWGSKITNQGAELLTCFPKLQRLNLAWTSVSIVPSMPRVSTLNLAHCSILSISEAGSVLDQLCLSGVTLQDPFRSLHCHSLQGLSVLELSSVANLRTFSFLSSLKRIVKLDLSCTGISSDTMHLLSECSGNLKYVDLSYTKVDSEGIGVLSSHVPALEYISLRGTSVTDAVFGYLGSMTSLVEIDLSETNLTGSPVESSLWSVLHLKQLPNLRRLDLRHSRFSDKSCKRLASLVQLTHLLLCAEFLTDMSLHKLSALPNLRKLLFQGTVLTDAGLRSLKPPPLLEELDLTGCWLVTEVCLLQFSGSFPNIILRHELLPGNTFPLRSRVQSRSEYNPGTKSAIRIHRNNEKDERIRYTFSELLNLRALTSKEAGLERSVLPQALQDDEGKS